jgi:hypothetical protein
VFAPPWKSGILIVPARVSCRGRACMMHLRSTGNKRRWCMAIADNAILRNAVPFPQSYNDGDMRPTAGPVRLSLPIFTFQEKPYS